VILIDIRDPSEHVKVIRSNIGLESVEKCRDVQNEPIGTNFRKKAKGIHLNPFFQTPLYFVETEDSNFKILYIKHAIIILEHIQISFFLYFHKYKTLEL
jgi:hypothetical protein